MFRSKTFKLCCLIIISCFAIWKIYIFLEQNSCLDNRNVWDYQENRFLAYILNGEDSGK